jgi:hypothetical protein
MGETDTDERDETTSRPNFISRLHPFIPTVK